MNKYKLALNFSICTPSIKIIKIIGKREASKKTYKRKKLVETKNNKPHILRMFPRTIILILLSENPTNPITNTLR